MGTMEFFLGPIVLLQLLLSGIAVVGLTPTWTRCYRRSPPGIPDLSAHWLGVRR
eukprot:CAMPEP_0180634552 /NCGR_PEP_ID=MMETSP1037_2-20121125/42191_1 /TAXON_ID=632150 /ORGANISM="Azadinium spinosum, Strain 3D9" /LENGTH=53 /DNA_ID=CAMNT_0022655699 /DNA_START=718 /DNA_END=875 /DNA_ORIENTATION=+